MKFLSLFLVLLLASSCANYRYTMKKRSIQYLDCVDFLAERGFKESNIDAFCSKALEK